MGILSIYLFIYSLNAIYHGNTSRVNILLYKIKEFLSQISHTDSTYFHSICKSFSTDFMIDQSIKTEFKHGVLFPFFKSSMEIGKEMMIWITNNTLFFFKF